MIENVTKDIYRIGVPLPNNPLKELNSYFIRGSERDILIDTGFRCPECRAALEVGLAELGSSASRRDVLITHLHSDHSGMADIFVGPGRYIYMSKTDLDYYKNILNENVDEIRGSRFIQEGFPIALLEHIQTINPAKVMALPEITEEFRGLKDGDVVSVGNYRLQTIVVPGHTPGNTMFWAAEHGVMFSGDHILFDITPNITAWPGMDDSLGEYLGSLKKAQAFSVRQTLPGHRKTGDYHMRIDALLHHHDVRLQESLQIIQDHPGLTAYEIAGKMTWKIRARDWAEFPPVQKWFAVGECLSHLDHLRKQEKLERILVNGIWHYTALQY